MIASHSVKTFQASLVYNIVQDTEKRLKINWFSNLVELIKGELNRGERAAIFWAITQLSNGFVYVLGCPEPPHSREVYRLTWAHSLISLATDELIQKKQIYESFAKWLDETGGRLGDLDALPDSCHPTQLLTDAFGGEREDIYEVWATAR